MWDIGQQILDRKRLDVLNFSNAIHRAPTRGGLGISHNPYKLGLWKVIK